MSNLISVKIVADSISPSGIRIITFELEYPRIIHSELMTHRLLSRNAMSSRAIPIKKMIEQVQQNPAMPVKFGKNQPGMQDAGEHSAQLGDGYSAEEWWKLAGLSAARFAAEFADAGYHKQIANRLLEPYQRMKTVVTATDWNNFFWLRVDPDADPTIYELAKAMKEASDNSIPDPLEPGQWHTPYVDHVYGFEDIDDKECAVFEGYCVLDEENKPVMLTLEEALAISASCCAQVSYRVLNTSKEKALDIYEKLVSGNKVHASPFEHQATPMTEYREIENSDYLTIGHINFPRDPSSWEEGITHADRQGQLWSGNLRGWRQHRQLVPDNAISG
ncbi:thymidylate synthase [Klebsiella phage KNP2]|uniref:thymidylate synthase n=1 Tax=Klebsiella phage KNP2 TaxID=1871716 RepID=UPI0018AD376D|nr:thymidylate synthase [Klebsiella phage KNP2]UVX65139.1 MAG: Thymidylate synthase complementing protein [Bacteriophage sp.]